ncbi:hypothetical protein [Methylotenera sp. G11]|uniref:hypothetical protein n=1 Tax=Methylotenera sp. G11 TaxID=1506585 RepID=UPI0006475F07|nr:hypothetical protein [Methylotenera sp. G11]
MPANHVQLIRKSAFFWGFFALAFLAVPYAELDHMLLMPGDIGDGRLNNYFLENIYRYIQGKSPSLVHLSFFYPFPYVLGFSDNHFGSSPAYLLPRAITGQADTAFQIWYLFGYFANYLAAYYALRKLDISAFAAAAGALIFAFALPVTAHSGHAQLHYRFGVPLAISAFIHFLERKDWRYFAAAAAWLVWQFYCTIYIGFFLLLMLAAMACVYVFRSLKDSSGGIKAISTMFADRFSRLPDAERIRLAVIFAALLFFTAVLFYPYLRVSLLYDARRHWHEISSMMPRLQSYFLDDYSTLWASQSGIFASLPMRHEHQMFVGAVPMLLAIGGYLLGRRQNTGLAFPLLSGSLALLLVLTLSIGGVSLWYVFSKLPLASAIRAMTRIILVFLFPVAFLGAVAIDRLKARLITKPVWRRMALFVMVPLLVFEFAATAPVVSSKAEWRHRLEAREQAMPTGLPPGAILFYAQAGDIFYADEIDAMWVALNHGLPTLNGYSGLYPPGYSVEFGNDCAELPLRIRQYLGFTGQLDNKKAYQDLMHRIVPVGFTGCDADWLADRPYTVASRAYSADELSRLSLEYARRGASAGKPYVHVTIKNSGQHSICAASAVNKPVRLSWRVIGADGKPLSGWDTRKSLPYDIPANGSVNVKIPVHAELAGRGRKLQISVVQEFVFWGHDIGIRPLELDWVAE